MLAQTVPQSTAPGAAPTTSKENSITRECEQDFQPVHEMSLTSMLGHSMRQRVSFSPNVNDGGSEPTTYTTTTHQRRTKARKQSGPAVAHMTKTCETSIRAARVGACLEAFDSDLQQTRRAQVNARPPFHRTLSE